MSRTSRWLVCASGCLGLWFGVPALPAPPNAGAPAVARASPPSDNAEAGEAAEAAEAAGDQTAPPQAAPNPYQVIVARNVFGLKEPPPPTPPPDPQAQVTPSALKLVILTTMLGKRASFVLQEPGKPPVNSDLLREGEKDSSITNLEVLKIDERAGTVKVIYGSKELTLDFKSNGIAPPVGPALPAAGPMLAGKPGPGLPPVPGQPAQPVAAATFHPLPQPGGTGYSAAGGAGARPIPMRPTRLGSDGSAVYGGGPAGGVARYGYNQPAQTQAQPNLTPEQQAVIMKLNEQRAAQQGIPLPPTPPMSGLDNQPGTQGPSQEQQSGQQLPPMPGAPIPLPPAPGN